jgi:hypothetical protein
MRIEDVVLHNIKYEKYVTAKLKSEEVKSHERRSRSVFQLSRLSKTSKASRVQ